MACIYDQGTEFTGIGFSSVLQAHGIAARPTTVKNPQANSVCERMHQTVANTLRTRLQNVPLTLADAFAVIDDALAQAMHANRIAIHRTLEHSPGALAFRRDMLLDIPLIVDFERMRERRQVVIDEQLRRQNAKRVWRDYQPGDRVWKIVYQPDKMQPRNVGPFEILQVHVNGTVTLQVRENQTERINIRRIKPVRG